VKTIHKFTVGFGTNSIEMPAGAKLLHVGAQGQSPYACCVWALVNTSAPMVRRHLCVFGTGHEVDVEAAYVGTTQVGEFVWHVFDLGEA